MTAITITAQAKPLLIAVLPIAFQVDAVPAAEFSGEEDSAILSVQEKFAADMTAAADVGVASPAYLRLWDKARWDADNRLRLELGAVGFNRLNSLAAQQAEADR